MRDGAPTTAPNGCTDALQPGAFTAVRRYCSDNSNRAPTTAPQHPHVVWSKTLDANLPLNLDVDFGLLVSPNGTAFLPGDDTLVAMTIDGDVAWKSSIDGTTMPQVGFLSLSGSLSVAGSPKGALFRFDETHGDKTSMPWPASDSVRVGADGAAFAHVFAATASQQVFGGVARVAADGKTEWVELGGCDHSLHSPGNGQYVRRGDHLVLACSAQDNTMVNVLEVDANDQKVWSTSLNALGLSAMALAPNGDVHFFVWPKQSEVTSHVIVSPDGHVGIGGLSLGNATVWAIANDGTLILFTNDGIAAVTPGGPGGDTIRWQSPVEPADFFVDDAETLVFQTKATVGALDMNTGTPLWTLPLPPVPAAYERGDGALAAAGSGKVYVATSALPSHGGNVLWTLTLVSD